MPSALDLKFSGGSPSPCRYVVSRYRLSSRFSPKVYGIRYGFRTRLSTHHFSAVILLACTLSRVRKPLTADVTSVENCFAIALNEEHDTSGAVVGIDEGHANALERGEFNHRRRVQRNWALNEVRERESLNHKI
jgi:hypothetical protein